jgi:hypothetical protein
MAGAKKEMVGIKAGVIIALDIDEALSQTKSIDAEMCNLAVTLSI